MQVLLSSLSDEINRELHQLESRIQCRLHGRIHDFRLSHDAEGLTLSGRAPTYHAKQLAQEAVMEATPIPIAANQIEVQATPGGRRIC